MTVPPVVGTSWSIVRASVDLPQPDSPTSPRTSPWRTESVTPSTALTDPVSRLTKKPVWIGKWVLTSLSSRMFSVVVGWGSGGPQVDFAELHAGAGVEVARRHFRELGTRGNAHGRRVAAPGGERATGNGLRDVGGKALD